MPAHTAYLMWLFIFLAAPTAVMWALKFHLLKHYIRPMLLVFIAVLVFAIPWDLWAVSIGVWGFPAKGISGIWILGLPLEEYLFMVLTTLQISSLTLILKYRRS